MPTQLEQAGLKDRMEVLLRGAVIQHMRRYCDLQIKLNRCAMALMGTNAPTRRIKAEALLIVVGNNLLQLRA